MTERLDQFLQHLGNRAEHIRSRVNAPIIQALDSRAARQRANEFGPAIEQTVRGEGEDVAWADVQAIFFDAPLGTQESLKGQLHAKLVVRLGGRTALVPLPIRSLQQVRHQLLSEIPHRTALRSAEKKAIVGQSDGHQPIAFQLNKIRLTIPEDSFRDAAAFLFSAQERLTDQTYGVVVKEGVHVSALNEELAIARARNPKNLVLVRQDGRKILLGGKNSLMLQLLNQVSPDMEGSDGLVLGYEVDAENSATVVRRLIFTKDSLRQLRDLWNQLEQPSLTSAMPNHPDNLRTIMDESYLDGLYKLAYERWYAQFRKQSAMLGGVLFGVIFGQLLNNARGIHLPILTVIESQTSKEVTALYMLLKVLSLPIVEMPLISRVARMTRYAILGRFEDPSLHPKKLRVRDQVNRLRASFAAGK